MDNNENSSKTERCERKFVADVPDLWVLSNHYEITTISITQTFLHDKSFTGDCHVRKEKCGEVVKYYFSRKGCDKKRGLRLILEDREISEERYNELLAKSAHPKAAVIRKTRYVFDYNEQIFNLDILKDEIIDERNQSLLSKGQAILMIELDFPEEHIEWPRHIHKQREITNDLSFTTKALAKNLKNSQERTA
jgi:hypothetical protein